MVLIGKAYSGGEDRDTDGVHLYSIHFLFIDGDERVIPWGVLMKHLCGSFFDPISDLRLDCWPIFTWTGY
jgi:hypothetical protein